MVFGLLWRAGLATANQALVQDETGGPSSSVREYQKPHWLLGKLRQIAGASTEAKLRRDISLRIAELKKRLAAAETYDTWLATAVQLDVLEGGEAWKKEPESPDYDWAGVRETMEHLRRLRATASPSSLAFFLRTCLYRSFGGTTNPRLHAHSRVGTKYLVEDYLAEVVRWCGGAVRRASHPTPPPPTAPRRPAPPGHLPPAAPAPFSSFANRQPPRQPPCPAISRRPAPPTRAPPRSPPTSHPTPRQPHRPASPRHLTHCPAPRSLDAITDDERMPLERRFEFLHETRHHYGRTALLFSGGASLGAPSRPLPATPPPRPIPFLVPPLEPPWLAISSGSPPTPLI
eukprot:tig00000254_g22509.t1